MERPLDVPLSGAEIAYLRRERARRCRDSVDLLPLLALLFSGWFFPVFMPFFPIVATGYFLFAAFAIWMVLILAWYFRPRTRGESDEMNFPVSIIEGPYVRRISDDETLGEFIGERWVNMPPHWRSSARNGQNIRCRVAELPQFSDGLTMLAIEGGPSIEFEQQHNLGNWPDFPLRLGGALALAGLCAIFLLVAEFEGETRTISVAEAWRGLQASFNARRVFEDGDALASVVEAEGKPFAGEIVIEAGLIAPSEVILGVPRLPTRGTLLTKAATERLRAEREANAAAYRAEIEAYLRALEHARVNTAPKNLVDLILLLRHPRPIGRQFQPTPGEIIALVDAKALARTPFNPFDRTTVDTILAALAEPQRVHGVIYPAETGALARFEIRSIDVMNKERNTGLILIGAVLAWALLARLVILAVRIIERRRAFQLRAARAYRAANIPFST